MARILMSEDIDLDLVRDLVVDGQLARRHEMQVLHHLMDVCVKRLQERCKGGRIDDRGR